MTDISVSIGTYLVMLIINSIVAGLFLYLVPIGQNTSAKNAIRYFALYFVSVAVAYSCYVARDIVDLRVSVFLTNFLFIFAAYCVLFGCYWRYDVKRHLYRHVALVHIVGFAIAQTLLADFSADFVIGRLLFSYVNIALVYLYAIYVYNKLSRQHDEPVNLITIGIFTAIVCLFAVPVTYYVTDNQLVFASMLLLIQNIATMVLFGCVFSSFMFEIIQRYKSISVIDDLTGLYNRRSFIEQSNKLLSAASRHHFPISVVICDIDFFKLINDKFGHHVGDVALQECAKSLTLGTREQDIVARFGGEEFVILLPQTDIEGAKIIANRICQRIAAIKLEIDDLEVCFTASFGIASLLEHSSLEAAIKSADNAMYFAKENGRNQVRAEDEFMHPRSMQQEELL